MKITVQITDLKKALQIVGRGVSTRPHLPILSGILLRVKDGEVSMVATDLEMSFWVRLSASIDEDGEVVVPARIFGELVSSFVTGKMIIETVEQKMSLKTEGAETEILCHLAADFPSIPRAGKTQVEIVSSEFRQKMDRVNISSAKDDTRPILTGVLWEIEDKKTVLAATDGFRLSVDEISLKKNDLKEKQKFVVPTKSLLEVAKVLSELGQNSFGVEFNKDDHQVVFGMGDVEVSSRLIEGEFPPFRQIVPNTYKLKMTMKKDDLVVAVKRASLFAKDMANVIKIETKDNILRVMSENTQIGKNVTEVEMNSEGEEMIMAFNAKYLLDYLSVVEGNEVEWETEGELKPSVFRDSGEPQWLQVVMPIRVQG
jgi:DNA polymerase-3 subunit beta